MLSLLLSACSSPARPLPEGVETLPLGPATVRIAHQSASAQQVIWLGDRLVQRTASGVVIERDAETLAMLQVLRAPAPVATLGLGPRGELLAGLSDGQLGRLDLDGRWAAIERLHAPPVWVGGSAGAPAALAASLDEQTWSLRLEILHAGGRREATLDPRSLGGPPSLPPDAVVADAGALWLAFDEGEFGGGLVRISQTDGALSSRQTSATGLVSARGAVWASGGWNHLGPFSAFILRISDADVAIAYEADEQLSSPPSAPGGPTRPVHHLRPWPGTEDWLVLSVQQVYRASSDFTTWARLPDLALRSDGYRPGGAMVEASVTDLQGGEAGVIALATRHDGLLRLGPGGEVLARSPRGVSAGAIHALLATPDGLVALGERSAGRLGAEAYTPLDGLWWSATEHWDVAPDGGVRATSMRQEADLRSLIGRLDSPCWDRGHDEALHCVSVDAPSQPDAQRVTLLRDGSGALLACGATCSRWEEPAWTPLGPVKRPSDGVWAAIPGVAGWALDRGARRLVAFGEDAVVQSGPEGVRAASAWDEQHLLAATDQGLRLVALIDGATGPSPTGEPGFEVQHLSRDGCGRSWMLGDRLAVWDGATLVRLPEVPEFTGGAVRAVAAIPSGVAWTDGEVLIEVSLPCRAG